MKPRAKLTAMIFQMTSSRQVPNRTFPNYLHERWNEWNFWSFDEDTWVSSTNKFSQTSSKSDPNTKMLVLDVWNFKFVSRSYLPLNATWKEKFLWFFFVVSIM